MGTEPPSPEEVPAPAGAPEPSFRRRFVKGLFAWSTLGSMGLCAALVLLPHLDDWPTVAAIMGCVWLFVGWCSAYGKSERARRARLHGAEREVRWADRGGPPLWANGFLLALIVFPLAAAAFFVGAFVTARNADALSKLKACPPGVVGTCIAHESGVIVARRVRGSQQSLDIALPTGLETVYLSTDGWGGRWRGRFPVGERVTVELHGSTPLAVTEPDGHHRNTADNPSDLHGFLFFMGWIFLGGTLPAALVLRHLQHARTDLARLTMATEGRVF